MSNINAVFKNRKVRRDRLLPFGFSKKANTYAYSAPLIDGQFNMRVVVDDKGEISADVIDSGSGDCYVLHRVSGAKGPFAGRIREEYENILAKIADACFEADVFKSQDAGQIIRYVREKYRDEPQFLWKRFPDNAIYRRQDSKKWYAALLTVQKRKLGVDEDGTIEIIDLRGEPENITALVDGRKYFPGYHMNKKHWFTICLNHSVPIREIRRRIDDSHALAAK